MEVLLSLGTKICIYGIYILSLNNVIMRNTSYWPVGQLAFFAIGALTFGILTVLFHFSGILIFLAIIIGVVIASLFSYLPALASFKLKGDFFILFSIAFLEITRVAVEYISGPSGFSHISNINIFSSDIDIFIISLFLFLLSSLYVNKLNNHPFSRLCIVAKSNEIMALSLGINTRKIKIIIFVLGGAIASLSGILFAIYSNSTDPQRFNTFEAIMLFALTIFGGNSSFKGTVVASITYVLLIFIFDSLLSEQIGYYAPKITAVILGISLIISFKHFPNGMFGNANLN